MAAQPQKTVARNHAKTNDVNDPSLRLERRLLRAYGTLVAIDECGRGSLSGPVFCGAVFINSSVARPPVGVRDSKLLSAKRREELLPRVQEWSSLSATGSASAREIDRFGILVALRLAALRALAALDLNDVPGVILLDGPLDWISPESARIEHHFSTLTGLKSPPPPIVTKVKGDRECVSLAAASILAKVVRDALMRNLDRRHPGYGWSANKGYASPTHVEGLRRLGPSPQHRRSWRLPGVES